MQSLLIGLFIGYFVTACAPVYWSGARVVLAMLVAALAIAGWNRMRRCYLSSALASITGLVAGGWVAIAVLSAIVWIVQQLPPVDECAQASAHAPIVMRVKVTGLPRRSVDGVRFDARVLDVADTPAACRSLGGGLIRLAWRDAAWPVPGQIIVGAIRLRSIRGSVSPGAFDHELHALKKGLLLGGYLQQTFSVREPANNSVSALLDRARWMHEAALLRYSARQYIERLQLPHGGVLLALLSGDAALLAPSTWDLLQQTGTVHLLVISGLHVGLIAGLLYLFLRGAVTLLWLVLPGWVFGRVGAGRGLFGNHGIGRAAERVLHPAGLTVPLLLAYVLFTGAGVPALRACVMVIIGLWALTSRRRVQPEFLLAIAALAVLLVDPFAGFSAGFWLSFGLVGWLLLGGSHATLQPETGKAGASNSGVKLWHRICAALQLHMGCTLALVPLLGWLDLPVALVGPIANLLAVPWVTLLLVPIVFVAGVLAPWLPEVAGPLFGFADRLVALLLLVLRGLSAHAPAAQLPMLPLMVLAGLFVVTLVALLPVPWRIRSVALLLLGIAYVQQPWRSPVVDEDIVAGQFVVHVLDVGQGLAVLVQTRTKTLLYDTGAAFPGGFSFADAVVAPALLTRAQGELDVLVISHGDNDHAGGSAQISERFLDNQQHNLARSGVVGRLGRLATDCWWSETVEGPLTRWRVDGVTLVLLQYHKGLSANDRSCVLVVRGQDRIALLAGDIEAAAEAGLLAELPAQVDLLVVPHHGSATSSTAAFVDRIRPALAVVSAGYENRFGHPHPDVLARYRAAGAVIQNTATLGSIRWVSEFAWPQGRLPVGSRQQRSSRWQPGAPLLMTGEQQAIGPGWCDRLPTAQSCAATRE